jgi:acetolactate synthase-1/2/3 large subunit
MTFDISEEGVSALNGLLDRSDLILAVGCKFTHNGTYGFKLHLPKEKLIHIDASSNVLNANYPARLAVCADSAAFFNRLYVSIERLGSRRSEWAAGELAGFKRSCGRDVNIPMPTVHGVRPPTPLGFFQALRAAMPANSCLVTDSGLHQVLASCYFRVNEPRGMIIPSDFQSMGFGLPAAVGAKLATPEKSIVVLIGDGGLAMSGMELITAVREQIPLTLIVFNDGALGQIRFQQLSSFGHSHSTKLKTPDLSLFAQSIGANYIYLEEDAENVLRAAVTGSSVTLIEVSVEDSAAMYFEHAKGLARQTARQLLKPSTLRWLKHKLSR